MMAHTQRNVTLSICFLVILLVLLYYPLSMSSSFSFGSLTRIQEWMTTSTWSASPATLGIFSKIYVVSLPRRTERREQMDRLKHALGLEWAYFSAVSNESEIVYAVMQRVKMIREECENKGWAAFVSSGNVFWPSEEIESLATSTTIPLDLWNHDFLNPADIPNLAQAWWSSPNSPLTCASRDFDIQPYVPNLKPHWLLTPARIACWHSHLSVIHLIANEKRLLGSSKHSVLILEDDVDMEFDIRDRLGDLWPLLPREWDIVFLGHCWSNESTSTPLLNPPASAFNQILYHVHPSHSPKCTHAYALTHTGARRLLLHLQHAPFAYSRAIDQAIAWLIESGRLKGFSIVPSLVAQRKVVESDVMAGKGSRWKDQLRNGVLG